AKLCINKPNQPNIMIGGKQPESVPQGKMNGCKNNLKGRREESHSKLLAARHFGKEIRLAVKAVPNGLFADRRSDYSLNRPRKGLLSRGFQICKGALSGVATTVSEPDIGGATTNLADKKHWFIGHLGGAADPFVFHSGSKQHAVALKHKAICEKYPSGKWQSG